MDDISVIFGVEHLIRRVTGAGDLVRDYRSDTGYDYLRHRSMTDPDHLVIEDLGVTLLMNSQVGWRAAKSVLDHGPSLNLHSLPSVPLEKTTPEERQHLAELIAGMTRWSGFAAAVATKILHKKRPALVPILDNQAIFGAYLNPNWNPPSRRASGDSVYDAWSVRKALDWIVGDLRHPDNAEAWSRLKEIEPDRTLIELFDIVWWQYFRTRQPVR